jgi:acyl-CoA synthetase (AMP-forming)/AMP-acid ligase II
MTTFFGAPAESETGIGALTLGGLLVETAHQHGDREAVVFHAPDHVVRWTYADLLLEARRYARAFIADNVVKGTRVAVLMGNRPEWLAAAFGVAMAGGVFVPLSTFMAPPELAYVLRHSDATVLVSQEQLLSHNYLDTIKSLCPEALDSPRGEVRSHQFPFLRSVNVLGVSSPSGAITPLEDFLRQGDHVPDYLVDQRLIETVPIDDGVIIYTSGTTSRPKAILHAHRSPTLQSWRFVRWLALDSDVRVWSPYPFFWTAGLTMIIGATLVSGGCLVLQEHFEPGEALRLLEVEGVTTPHARAHQVAQLEDHPDWTTRDLSTLRHVNAFTSFTRHPSVKLEKPWYNRAAYGLTETFANFSYAPADLPPEELVGNNGWIQPGNAVRILDPATGTALCTGDEGEIAIKGLTVMKGYLKVPPEQVFDEDGFFHTGDSGFVDERGRLHWTGRASLMIKTGGANVSPLEIEEELLKHPAVKLALVLGVPDEARDELVVACVVVHSGNGATEDDLRQFLRGRVASYKIPRRVFFFSDEEFIMTGNNARVRSDDMRPLVIERLSVDE